MDIHSSHVIVETTRPSGDVQFPTQTWPVVEGRFIILTMLSPGPNRLIIRPDKNISQVDHVLDLEYIPLEVPPLHLAIMVAKDSPLVIDCPAVKHSGISSAHSSLEAAIAKFRMTAYMWQAVMAEDMRMKGLGRRSFRLEEEWAPDTTSASFFSGLPTEPASFISGAMRSTAKVHVVPSEHTVEEIRNPQAAKHETASHDDEPVGPELHDFFKEALSSYTDRHPSLATSARPIVACLILDSRWSPKHGRVLGDSCRAIHDPEGVSYAMRGSQCTYAWPRCLEEVTSCLLDSRPPGDTVAKDPRYGGPPWSLGVACAIGQAFFFGDVGRALGIHIEPYKTFVPFRTYTFWEPNGWARLFTPHETTHAEDDEEGSSVAETQKGEPRWPLEEALAFSKLPHFWTPSDRDALITVEARSTNPVITPHLPELDDAGLITKDASLTISSQVKIAQIQWNDLPPSPVPSPASPVASLSFTAPELSRHFPREGNKPLSLVVIGANGKRQDVRDVWRMLRMPRRVEIPIPSVDFCLERRGTAAGLFEEWDDTQMQTTVLWDWAVLLRRRGGDGRVSRAGGVEVRTDGSCLAGLHVVFDEGQRVICGPLVDPDGNERREVGCEGHVVEIPKGGKVIAVEVVRGRRSLVGVKFVLSDGSQGGWSNDWEIPRETEHIGEYSLCWSVSCPGAWYM